jgi:hypothetical protein
MILYSVIESPTHPNFSTLYQSMGLQEQKLTSSRKTMSQLKAQPPDFLVAEFFYGFSNNYAGINISNLDVMLYSMQKYAPDARLIIMVSKDEREYVDKLSDIFPIHAVLQHPVREADMRAVLGG